uniref:Putative phosphotransferase n=1 Tax=Streptomyces sp. FR1 TaxID=349971 RepID=V9Z576_9ACTN|nr:phosphotransferase [Streptomyces sp. FR1]AHE39149.1 Putative phosphotransferase [Streptomyces sp. FR1]
MAHGSWTDEDVLRALHDRYALRAVAVTREDEPGRSIRNWYVEREAGPPVRVLQYLDRSQLASAKAGLDMAEYCRAASLKVPRVWPDSACHLLSDDGEYGMSVADVPAGKAFIRPLTVHQAQALGLSLALMHQALAAYPQPTETPGRREAAWAECPVEDVIYAHEAAALAAITAGARDSHASEHLHWVRRHLPCRVGDLRAAVPEVLTAHAIHGAFVPPNIRADEPKPVITGFRARCGYLVWELARVAFDVRTVAEGTEWEARAAALLSAYHHAFPAFPVAELVACPSVALLELLCTPTPTAQPGSWAMRASAARRLSAALPELEVAIRRLGTHPQRHL